MSRPLATEPEYDVIVVGAGHAGCEAAAAAANLGCRTLLVTMDMTKIAQMSCNPAMGGVAKGQIVREIDALGGYSGIVTDKTAVQFRMLNRSKGPAMWSPRAQSDRMRFTEAWRQQLETLPLLDFWQDMVSALVLDGNVCRGIVTSMGKTFRAETVIMTNGTFLNGLIHMGEKQATGGRSGERAATGLSEQLAAAGMETGRMKTGTPPRLDGRTIDYSKLTVQPGDEAPGCFSYLPDSPRLTNQLVCWMGYTNAKVHSVLEQGFDRSPMFNGRIQGRGPRYCPSIEDKITRFADKTQHQLFVEPEGWNTVEIYLNGFSSSLPEEVQYEALRHIEGFEHVKMFRPGYAIEYDYFPPHQLRMTLETRAIENLFFAGQINGTTGYEEAAAQGLMAGINAALKVKEKEPFLLGRDEAYIGVLIDDLITKGTDEPYRMFTSRAEYRILLRQDNADLRLTERSHQLGLASESRFVRLQAKRAAVSAWDKALTEARLEPADINAWLESKGEVPIRERVKAKALLLRNNVDLAGLATLHPALAELLATTEPEFTEQAEIQIKYAGYVEKEREQVAKLHRLEGTTLPEQYDYTSIKALSNEARQKLSQVRPRSIGQASRISGVTPSDISVLLVHLGR